jgi:hypothetical protein
MLTSGALPIGMKAERLCMAEVATTRSVLRGLMPGEDRCNGPRAMAGML